MFKEVATRQKLMQTALDLIWGHSYGAISVDEICKRAGVLKGSFYHFFRSKSDLAVAAYEEYWTTHRRPRLDQAFSPQVPPVQRFILFCDQVYESQSDRLKTTGKVCGCPFGAIGSELSGQDDKIRDKSKEIAARYRQYFVSALREGMRQGVFAEGDPETLARDTYSLVTGVLLQARIHDDLDMIKSLKPAVLRLLGVSVAAAA